MAKSKKAQKVQENVVAEVEVEVKEKPKKKAPTKFAVYVRENYEKVKDLPNKDRLKKLSEMYKEHKQTNQN